MYHHPEVGLAGKITAFHEAFFRELTEAEKAFDEATINLEDFFDGRVDFELLKLRKNAERIRKVFSSNIWTWNEV